MSNSSLVNYVKISPNKTSPRNHPIDKITIHHMAGNLSVESCGNVFAPSSRQASSNYAVDSNGRVGMYVEEKDRSWCSSNKANDHRAVTIEVADDQGAPNWHSSDKAMSKLVELCTDICKRNGISRLNYTGDANGNLTMHKWFANTDCPGNYLESKFPWIADEVNKRLNGESSTPSNPDNSQNATNRKYKVGDFVTVGNLYKSSTAPIGEHISGKWSGTITRVLTENVHNPYLLGNGTGWFNDGDVIGTNQSSSGSSSGKITVDGKWGTATTKKAQQVFGCSTVDGVMSNQLSCYKSICAGIVGGVQWEENKRSGSILVKKMQAWMGITQDGWIGPNFITTLQAKMGTVQDGKFSNPSTCIKKFQEWLNNQ